ncbi:DUF4136 domain-containing protein [Shewanella sp. AS16]|uniref:DUF4136 domain-containing protein n=1 Tax=Shewanella sp. AS16 TaxID=2907625 RepID=UPI001F17E308|nr:DUF4136 domain-containing protein [Shewanella sp. AS16]MCE9685404.1 DUF4136 domain-containing protein [Shewanella sp. AS16]
MPFRRLVLHRLMLACLSLSLLYGCSSQPKQDYALNYDFTRLHSYALLPNIATDDPLSSQRIQADITKELRRKGFAELAQGGDFLVGFSVRTQDKPADSGLSLGLGTGSWGRSGGVSVGTSVGIPLGSETAKRQTIQIDILDSANRRLVWRGSDSFDFDTGAADKAMASAKAVARILARFPPRQ